MDVHIHKWVLNGSWKCTNNGHVHPEPDMLDAATAWHVLGVIKTHKLRPDKFCDCGWSGPDYYEHLDDAVFYWLRSLNPQI